MWCQQLQFFGMSGPESIEAATVSLALDTTPRRFRTSEAAGERLSEEQLLTRPGHFLLLGDPGAGKTTTIKRLARALLFDAPVGAGDQWQAPVVVRLRELTSPDPIEVVLAERMGIRYDVVREKKKPPRYICGNSSLLDVVADAVNRGSILLLLDGLDEAPSGFRSALEDSILQFARQLSDAKIVMSCRSGDYTRTFEGFATAELCGLDPLQVVQIAERWLGNDSEDFLFRLDNTPYSDLANRPLFLCQLLVIYRNGGGELPDEPRHVYQKVVDLCLERWDRTEKRLARQSRYSSFGSGSKREFLAALAYELTYRRLLTRFREQELLTPAY